MIAPRRKASHRLSGVINVSAVRELFRRRAESAACDVPYITRDVGTGSLSRPGII